MNTEQIIVFIQIHAKTGQEASTKDIFLKTIATSHKPGIISAEIFEDRSSPGTFFSI